MDRHAEFFVHPLFDKNFLDKERTAVDEEFNRRIADESDRLWAVLKQLTNPLHPFSRFSIGNIATLPGGNQSNALRETTMQFYNTYYTLNRMSLGILVLFFIYLTVIAASSYFRAWISLFSI